VSIVLTDPLLTPCHAVQDVERKAMKKLRRALKKAKFDATELRAN